MTQHLAPLLALLPPLAGGQFLRTYLSPAPIAVIGCGVALYLWGVARQDRLHPRHPWPAHRTAAFLGGAAVTAFAMLSFLGVYDTTLFWDHMLQHLLLIMVAGILLAASSPIALAWRATTGASHRRLSGLMRSRVGQIVGHPATAFVLYGVFVPLTHLTIFFNWAIEYRSLDEVEHFLFLGVGYLFWRQIFGVDPNRYRTAPPIRALLLFIAVPVDTFVGLTLNSENHEIFPAFTAEHRTWGPSLVTDLHMGGVIMWVGGDMLMMLALIPVVVEWVRLEERSATRFDRELEAFFPPAASQAGQPTAGFALGRHSPRRGPSPASASAAAASPSPSGSPPPAGAPPSFEAGPAAPATGG